MLIDMIDDTHLKVELTGEDMISLEIDRTSFIQKSERAKLILKSILRNAYEQTGFDIFSTHLLIEIFPTSDEGCLMLFTKSEDTKKAKFKLKKTSKTDVYKFDKINDLLFFCRAVKEQNLSIDNSLYLYKNKYYLSISLNKFSCEKLRLLIYEFNGEKSKISKEFLIEHAKVIIEKNAVQRLNFNS